MKLGSLINLGFAFLLFAVIPALSQSYDEELRLGVAAYKGNHYEDAIKHFRKATELDPGQATAHMYLATGLVSQYIPGVDSPGNLRFAEDAIDQYRLYSILASRQPRRSAVAKASAIST